MNPPSGSNNEPPEPPVPVELLEEADSPPVPLELLDVPFVEDDEDAPPFVAEQAHGSANAGRTKKGRIERRCIRPAYHRSGKLSATTMDELPS